MAYIKSPEDVAKIKEGGKKIGEILDTLALMVKPGVSAWDIDQKADKLIKEAGGVPAFRGYKPRPTDTPFPSVVCVSRNSEIVHGFASKEKVFEEGDIVSLDIGMVYPEKKGCYTDTAITVPVGNIDEKTKQLLSVTKKALEVGIAAAQAGNSVADIGRAVEQYVSPQGYGIVRDLVGHGVGHAVHEEPRVPNYYDQELEDWELKPGAVIAIEPMLTMGNHTVVTGEDGWTISTEDNSLNAHFEHTVIISEDGPVVATRRPDEK